MMGESLGANFFVGRERSVSLSRRLAARGEYFGAMNDSLDTWRASPLWQRMAASQSGRSCTPCSACGVRDYCGGYWAGEDVSSCETWQAALEPLLRVGSGFHSASADPSDA